MRIPRSAIVMGIACAVPFGLAIRDSLRGPAGELDPDGSKARVRHERALEQGIADDRAQAGEEAASRERARRGALRRLFGVEPASRGEELDDSAMVAAMRGYGFKVDVEHGSANRAVATAITLPPDVDLCGELRTQLRSSWHGGETFTTPQLAIWNNPRTHAQAALTTTELGCTLRFSDYVDWAQWIGAANEAVVPVDVAGLDWVHMALRAEGYDAMIDPKGTASWLGAGPPHAMSGTEVTVKAAGSDPALVVSVDAKVALAPGTTLGDLAEALREPLGVAVQNFDAHSLEWKLGPAVVRAQLDPGGELAIHVGRSGMVVQ